MGVLNRERREIHAKIVYFGPDAAGKTTNLEFIHRKLKRDHRGEIKTTNVGNDRSATYEFLAVTLGAVRGYSTSIHIYTVPNGPSHREMRRQILDGADGIVFVADLRPERHDATVEAAGELKDHLQSYGLSLKDVVLVIQYNRRGPTDENALDGLHRRLGLDPEGYFEAVASEGTGVLQTLTSLSKQILSNIRQAAENEPGPEAVALARVGLTQMPIEEAGGEGSLSTNGFRVEGPAQTEACDGELRIPILVTDEESGRKLELCVRLSLSVD